MGAANGEWTSGRIETRRANSKAPAGGVLRIESRLQMPNVTGAAALGYWPFTNGVAGRATPTAQTTPGRPMLVDHVAVWTRP
ncbi:hypothetical protein [Lentzea flaviverrucosa]|uniref:Uncharacterized protein n=1 Tax=Lentzea flaviverrucosa TaxID=200379 RepID=A0A1H9G1W0_9PSEU|nr:hypothetical protein [Lentzea flaviverrucosa]RDI35035.1 hypothetical protein DFR72_101785 [Lentzea flaviverrucosa]SEQ44114.1 hypothetical protein SAMN05216195_102432 [Lentzea flaviverrucosa]